MEVLTKIWFWLKWNTRVIRLHPYNKRWDSLLTDIMDNGELIAVDLFTADYLYNGMKYEVWISNFPYGFGCLWAKQGDILRDEQCFSCSTKNAYRLWKIAKQEQKRLDALEKR